MFEINVGDLFFTELGRLSGPVLCHNSTNRDLLDQEFNPIDSNSVVGFDYHIETSGVIPNTDVVYPKDNEEEKMIIKYVGNGEFEEITSHEKMTLQTYLYSDPIWDALGIDDFNLKRPECIVYDDPEIIKEQISYFKNNPLQIYISDEAFDEIRPISELNQEDYAKYSDELRIEQIRNAKELALLKLEDSISKMDNVSQEMINSGNDEKEFHTK